MYWWHIATNWRINKGRWVLGSYLVLCWRHSLICRVSRGRDSTLESIISLPCILCELWEELRVCDLDGIVPAVSVNVALFATNKASWTRFIGLVIFATFIWLATSLMSAHTI